MKLFFTELALRWKMEGPLFFKKLKVWMLWLGSVCGAILVGGALPEVFTGQIQITDLYPEWFINLMKIGVTIGAVGWALSRLPVRDPQQLQHEINKKLNEDGLQ